MSRPQILLDIERELTGQPLFLFDDKVFAVLPSQTLENLFRQKLENSETVLAVTFPNLAVVTLLLPFKCIPDLLYSLYKEFYSAKAIMKQWQELFHTKILRTDYNIRFEPSRNPIRLTPATVSENKKHMRSFLGSDDLENIARHLRQLPENTNLRLVFEVLLKISKRELRYWPNEFRETTTILDISRDGKKVFNKFPIEDTLAAVRHILARVDTSKPGTSSPAPAKYIRNSKRVTRFPSSRRR